MGLVAVSFDSVLSCVHMGLWVFDGDRALQAVLRRVLGGSGCKISSLTCGLLRS